MTSETNQNNSSRFQQAKAAIAAFVLSCLLIPLCAAAQPDLRKAEALVKAGNPAEAYKLLEPFETELAGDPKYDYLLGIAALDSGRADKATLAFERVLAVEPNFAGARLDMARAYFQLGDMTRAKAEFSTVLEQNPPPAARQLVDRYLNAIAEREKAKKTIVTGYMEATLGHDSNVNNSTSQTQVIVPALGNLVFTLNPTNVGTGDRYGLITGGADIAHEVNPNLAVFGGVLARYRGNEHVDVFNYKSAEAHGGFVVSGDSTVFRATASTETYYLDNLHNRDSRGLAADMRYAVNRTNYATAFTQYTQYRFSQDTLAVNDFDQMLLGAGWLRLYHDGRSALNGSLFVGHEDDKKDRADGNKDILGARIGGQLNLRENLDFIASVGWQQGRYDKQNVSFQATRRDHQLDWIGGLVWRLNSAWSVRPQVLYIRNDSNIPIYGYKRTDYSVTLRYDFR